MEKDILLWNVSQHAFFCTKKPQAVCVPLSHRTKILHFYSEFGLDHVPPIKTSLNICGFSDCFSLPSRSDPVKEKNKHISVGIFERKNFNYICLNQRNHWRSSENTYKSISILQAMIPGYGSVTKCLKQFTNNIKIGWLHVTAIKTELQREKKEWVSNSLKKTNLNQRKNNKSHICRII